MTDRWRTQSEGVDRATGQDGKPGLTAVKSLRKRLLVRNERVAIVIDTPSLGRVTVVMVAAVIVGRITVTALEDAPPIAGTKTLQPPQPVTRGDEIGIFHLGSTVVMFVEPHVKLCRPEGPVRYGQSLLAAS